LRRIGWPMAPDATSPDLPGSFTALLLFGYAPRFSRKKSTDRTSARSASGLLYVLPPWRAKV